MIFHTLQQTDNGTIAKHDSPQLNLIMALAASNIPSLEILIITQWGRDLIPMIKFIIKGWWCLRLKGMKGVSW